MEPQEEEIPEEEVITTEFIQNYLNVEETSEIEVKLKVLKERTKFDISEYGDLQKLL